eukprot:gb/GFBE01081070.1/.p1 GENE.gb/GFBE01081070.1/~~gb/GFBE01081070.1/.p1  ORF type:complete len:285 (+),score=38.37 gb/GFBE01081070.1/:1-855(+)
MMFDASGGHQGTDGLFWFYLDLKGKEFGPFSNHSMRYWFDKGFFPREVGFVVRPETWKTGVNIRLLWPNVFDSFASPPDPILLQVLGLDNVWQPATSTGTTRDTGAYSMAGSQTADATVTTKRIYSAISARSSTMDSSNCTVDIDGGNTNPGSWEDPAPQGLQEATSGNSNRMRGIIKSFNWKQGFGFIESQEAYQVYGRDVFLHKAQIGKLNVGAQVTFCVELNRQSMPQARDLFTLDGIAAAEAKDTHKNGTLKGRSSKMTIRRASSVYSHHLPVGLCGQDA